jgi:hypothetical protein
VKKRRPRREHPGQKQISCWLEAELVDRMSAHVRARPGAQLRVEVGAALEQYLARAPAPAG